MIAGATSKTFIARTLCRSRSALQTQIRYAGGGGRPGGKPTFNWKERMALRLARKGDQKVKPFRVVPTGDWDDIAPYFDEAKGHSMIDITNLDSFEAPHTEEIGEFEGEHDTRKSIDVSRLFGKDKARGAIPKKYNYGNKRFSHKRVFGQRE